MTVAGGVALTAQLTQCGEPMQGGVGQAGLKLGIQYPDLMGDAFRLETGSGQYIHQSNQPFFARLGGKMQVEVGGVFIGASVITPAVLTNPTCQLAGARKIGRAQKQGVLKQVGQAAILIRLIQIAYTDSADQAL